MHEPDLPKFEKGKPLTADQLNQIVAAIRPTLGTGTFWSDWITLQRPTKGGGSGGSTSNLTSFALVKVEAGASTYGPLGISGGTIGKAQLLSEFMTPVGPLPGQQAGDEYVEFRSMHQVKMVPGRFITLHSNKTIIPGSKYDVNGAGIIWGKFINSVDELWELQGRAAAKVLWTPGNSGPTDIKWDGQACSSP